MDAERRALALLTLPVAAFTAESTTAAPITTTRTEFHFERTGADWHVLAYAGLAIALGWWALTRYGPAPAGLAGRLAKGCRVAALVLAVILLAGPAWRTTTTTAVPGRLLVAIDRSASMARADLPDRRPRSAAAGDLRLAIDALAANRNLIVDWQSVGGVAGTLEARDFIAGGPSVTGVTSPLTEELLRLVDATRYDLVVLVSDGRVTEGAGLDVAATTLRGRDLPVFALATGGDSVDPALWLSGVVVNPNVALGEIEPVLVRLNGRQLGEGPVTVRLLVDGKVAVERTIDPGAAVGAQEAQPLEARLEAEFAKQGEAALRIEIQQGELKDARDLRVAVMERKLQVLILDSRPRYELRYLREALRRDHTIELHAYLAEGKRWRRWSEKGPADHLPLTPAEIRDYDVILLGDVAPDQFTAEQLDAIDGAVRKNASGLIWLLGETGATAGFAKHRLGELLPTRLPGAEAIAAGFLDNQPRRPSRTPTAEALHLFDAGAVTWDRLPELLGAAPLGELRPGSEALMQDQDGRPLLAQREQPPGRVVIVGTDDTWRWRRNVGDAYLTRFYGQLLRHAGAGRRHSDKLWRLVTTPARAVPGETLTVTLAPQGPPPENPPDRAVAKLVAADGREIIVPLTAVPGGGGYAATINAPTAGAWRLVAVDGVDAKLVEEGELDVVPPASEVRDPRADPAALAALARSTGGQVFTDAASLAQALPDVRKDRMEILPSRGLWDTAWALALLVTLLAIEWSLRRWNRLP